MVTKKRYQIKLHKLFSQEDLLILPVELQEDFSKYQQVLSLDPYETRGVPSHSLTGTFKISFFSVCSLTENSFLFKRRFTPRFSRSPLVLGL
ncbi:MAG: hypothetical protein AB4057_23910 [Crocosphaera sp.]